MEVSAFSVVVGLGGVYAGGLSSVWVMVSQ